MNDNPTMAPEIGAKTKIVWALLRLAIGWTFFWAFLDKLFGLGFKTCVNSKTMEYMGVLCDKGTWLTGGSPTMGFLKFATKGPLAGIFQSMAGNGFVDWLFMLGLALIGLAMLLGVGVRIAGYSGALMLILMYLAASIPPENNPFLDEHITEAIICLGLASVRAGRFWGLGQWWANTALVRRFPILE
jgi:thiosulfate dehydrogenase [quinone] large subunit